MSRKRHKATRDNKPIPTSVVSPAPKVKRLAPLTNNQSLYLAALAEKKVTVCTGPAGCGKTYLAMYSLLKMLQAGEIARIILTRPQQDCDEHVGYKPGTTEEKIAEKMAPFLEALDEFLEPGELDKMRADGRIVLVVLGEIRGRTIKNAAIVLDEAQNATFRQLRMFLTRFGSKAKMVVCGDVTQSDLPYTGTNSLGEMVARFLPQLHPSVGVVQMGSADIVRDELVQWFEEVMTKPMKAKR